MVDILLRQADELLVASEGGGYAQGLVGTLSLWSSVSE